MSYKICDLTKLTSYTEGATNPVYKMVNDDGVESVMKIYRPEDSLTYTYGDIPGGVSEINIMTVIDHPNVVKKTKLYTRLNCNTFNYTLRTAILMKPALSSLSALIGGGLTLNISQSMLDCLTGVAELHKNNILHLDIKEGNALLYSDGAKISDFGLSKYFPDIYKPNPIEYEVITIPYRPIEILEQESQGEERTVSYASDIYSLGIMFITLYSNRPSELYSDYYLSKGVIINDIYSEESLIKVYSWLVTDYIPSIPDPDFRNLIQLMIGDVDSRPHAEDLIKHPFFTSRGLTSAPLTLALIVSTLSTPNRLSDLAPFQKDINAEDILSWYAIDLFCRVTTVSQFQQKSSTIYDFCYILVFNAFLGEVFYKIELDMPRNRFDDDDSWKNDYKIEIERYSCFCNILQSCDGHIISSSLYEKFDDSQLSIVLQEIILDPSLYLVYMNKQNIRKYGVN